MNARPGAGSDKWRERCHRAKIVWLAALVMIGSASVPKAREASSVAQVKKVTGQVTILRSGERLPAKVGDLLFEKDLLETGPNGSIGITFVDNTVFSTGPNSRLAIDEFRFDSNNFQGSMLADIRQGTLAVVSGDIPRISSSGAKQESG